MKVIGLEEHFVTDAVLQAWRETEPEFQDAARGLSQQGRTGHLLTQLGDERLAVMDETGVNIQVMSLSTPGVQNLLPDLAVGLQTETNDLLSELVGANPARLQGFATLATSSPQRAADELARAVRTLGLDGALIFGHSRGRTLDHPDFWPIFEAASALRAPLYLHPQTPPPAVRTSYYSGFGDEIDAAFATHGIGWHYDAGLVLLRMMLAGVFDRFPDLQIILGHWGEVILFYLERIDNLGGVAELPRTPSEYVRSHVYVTPGGVLSQRYLRWSMEVVGAQRIMFATDYPFVPLPRAASTDFLQEAELSEDERTMIASGNWERVRAGIRR
jgi:uncharacterized protein